MEAQKGEKINETFMNETRVEGVLGLIESLYQKQFFSPPSLTHTMLNMIKDYSKRGKRLNIFLT